MTIQIAVLNASNRVPDSDVQRITAALEKQGNMHVAPAWFMDDVKLTFVPTGKRPAVKSWWITFVDNADVADALGYHDLTSDGCPISKVFCDGQTVDGVSVTASHELCEMMVDPFVNLMSQARSGSVYAYEVCDPCEADALGYRIDGVAMSDFVFPAWFQILPNSAKQQYDYTKKIKRAFQILPGGYAQRFEDGEWHQLTMQAPTMSAKALHPQRGSRREKRARGADAWQLSAPKFENQQPFTIGK